MLIQTNIPTPTLAKALILFLKIEILKFFLEKEEHKVKENSTNSIIFRLFAQVRREYDTKHVFPNTSLYKPSPDMFSIIPYTFLIDRHKQLNGIPHSYLKTRRNATNLKTNVSNKPWLLIYMNAWSSCKLQISILSSWQISLYEISLLFIYKLRYSIRVLIVLNKF